MSNRPLISIVIPVYNVEQYLDECMNSVLKQTYAHLDIILVDDGSKDNSSKMCDAYGELDSRVQVLHKKNGGLMSAWMAGVEIARGDYLVFVDSDDWIEADMLEELAFHATGSDREIICSNYIIEKTEKAQSIKIKQAMKPGIYDRKAIEQELFPVLLGLEERSIHASRCMKLISRKLIVENLQYLNQQVTMGEDLSIMLPAILDAERIVVLEEGFFYHYRFVNASMAHKYSSNLYEMVSLLENTMQRTIEQKLRSLETRNMFLENLKKEYIFLLFLVLKNELRGPGQGMYARIQHILQDAKYEKQLDGVEIDVTGLANKFLFYIWKKENVFRITIGRLIINIFFSIVNRYNNTYHLSISCQIS